MAAEADTRLTVYEKLKSVLDQERTSESYKKPNLPTWRLSSWKVREENYKNKSTTTTETNKINSIVRQKPCRALNKDDLQRMTSCLA